MFSLGLPPPPARPRTPVPKFKYLDDPASAHRAYAHRQMPLTGDFCVVRIDHVASVADLGPEAMKAAKRISSKPYVGYICMTDALPYEGNATNLYSISFVSAGVPLASAYCDDTPACIPIHPNSECFGERPPIEACAPFPWPNCYLSTFTTKQFRVTTARRDYSPVLCIPTSESSVDIFMTINRDAHSRADFYERRREGDPDALALMPFSPGPESPSDPLSFLPASPSPVASEEHDAVDCEGTHVSSPNAGLTDTPATAFSPKGLSDITSASSFKHILASAMFDSGSNEYPIVDIWYDLDMVPEVRDPEGFMVECDMLEQLRWHFEDLMDKVNAGVSPAAASRSADAPLPSPPPKADSTLETPLPTNCAHTPIDDGKAPASEMVALPTTVAATTVAHHELSNTLPHSNDNATRSPTLSPPVTLPAARSHPARPQNPALIAPSAVVAAAEIMDAERATASNVQRSVGPVRSASLRSMRHSSSKTSTRSRKGSATACASPTKSHFPLRPHPYAVRPTRSSSTLSYAVPRSRHDTYKSLRKSRSSVYLKAPRRGETFPVPSSRSTRH
ncbi:unnamed protein product [Peniophora sp. CBMAI 1063]|nr:unnamed protein product [Peniophora sp. CBMAI 1063]